MNAVVDTIAVTAPVAIDWQSVEAQFRTTSRSVREIAAAYGVSHPAVLKRAKRDGWTRTQPEQVDAHKVASAVATETASAPAITGLAAATLVTAKQSQSAATPVTASRPPTQGKTAMQFRSPDPENLIHLANTAGHTTVVPAEFGDLPPMFHRDAILAGAEVSGTLSGELQKTALLLSADKAEREAADSQKTADAARDKKWFQHMVQDDPRSASYRRPLQD